MRFHIAPKKRNVKKYTHYEAKWGKNEAKMIPKRTKLPTTTNKRTVITSVATSWHAFLDSVIDKETEWKQRKTCNYMEDYTTQ